MKKTFFVLLTGACLLLGTSSAFGIGQYLYWFTLTYPALPNPSCSICHVNPNGGGAPFTSYGSALGVTAGNLTQSQFAAALSRAAAAPSICSGYTNGQLINLGINPGTGPCPTPTPTPRPTPTPIPTPTPTPTPTPSPSPTSVTMPCPTAEQVFMLSPVASPVPSADPTAAAPIAIVVEQADDVDILLNAAFDCPVDITLSGFAPGIDSEDIFFVNQDNTIKRFSESVGEAVIANGCAMPGNSENDRRKKFQNLILFKTNVSEVDVGLEGLDFSLSPGTYIITLGVTPTGSQGNTFYRWVTYFTVP